MTGWAALVSDPIIKITNKLDYARRALRGGEAAVTGAIGKAARHMAYVIDGQIAKKLGAK